jgi:ceramide glucosyltransferase
MSELLAVFCFALAAVGLTALLAQCGALRRHLRSPGVSRPAAALLGGRAETSPGISILKPLCGIDDQLEQNLASFAALPYPRYEVLLGVKSPRDPAWPVARAAARRWPERMRVVVQRFDGGLNPKVNQLVGLARAARHPLLVVSDSNVRVRPDYLHGIAAALADPAVGLVTHPVAGVGERRVGSILENLHLAGSVAPGMVAAQRLAGRDLVVGKSMALRRADLARLGGFESVQDVLAEDYVLGVRVRRELGLRVQVAASPVENVNEARAVRAFLERYGRWSVMQRKLVGTPTFAAQALLNPVLLAAGGLAAGRDARALCAFAMVCAAKTALDAANGRALRPGGFALRHLLLVPLKDLAFGAAFLHGFLSDEVAWRGNRLRVLPGSRLEPVPRREAVEPAAALPVA